VIAAVDVDYRDAVAVAVAVWFDGWAADAPTHQAIVTLNDVAAYEPGAFYRRELPALLRAHAGGPPTAVVVVDGYVWLGDEPGLGKRLFDALQGSAAVIGVSKTRYRSATAVEVCRGASLSPLYVTSVGIDLTAAAAGVRAMHGPYRVPTLLKYVDRLCRTAPAGRKMVR
jgi:deoxyribonuclease V